MSMIYERRFDPKDFETMMQLAYLQFTDVNFDKAVFDSYVIKQKKILPSLLANPEIISAIR